MSLKERKQLTFKLCKQGLVHVFLSSIYLPRLSYNSIIRKYI